MPGLRSSINAKLERKIHTMNQKIKESIQRAKAIMMR